MAQQHIIAGSGMDCATGLRPVVARQAGNSVESASFIGSSDHVRGALKPGGHFGPAGNSPWQSVPTSSLDGPACRLWSKRGTTQPPTAERGVQSADGRSQGAIYAMRDLGEEVGKAVRGAE